MLAWDLSRRPHERRPSSQPRGVWISSWLANLARVAAGQRLRLEVADRAAWPSGLPAVRCPQTADRVRHEASEFQVMLVTCHMMIAKIFMAYSEDFFTS